MPGPCHASMERDEAILAQIEGIQHVQRQQPLIGQPEAVSSLVAEYEDAVFVAKIQVCSRSCQALLLRTGDVAAAPLLHAHSLFDLPLAADFGHDAWKNAPSKRGRVSSLLLNGG